MGTRHLTCVVKDGEFKVAQYGQWDGYPDGQGSVCLEFLRDWNRNQFVERLDACITVDKEAVNEFTKSIGSTDGWLTMEQSDKFKIKYPQFSRDMGADILRFIADSTEPVELKSDVEFAGDGLFCEWVWLIDLDKNRFECYAGFNKTPLTEGERFAFLNKEGEEYSPPPLKASWSLDDLPDNDKFLSDCAEDEEE
jgi:hypothetical protein